MSATEIYTMIFDWEKAKPLLKDGSPTFSLSAEKVQDVWAERAKCEIESPKLKKIKLYNINSRDAEGENNFYGYFYDLVSCCIHYLFFYLNNDEIIGIERLLRIIGANTVAWCSEKVSKEEMYGIINPESVIELNTILKNVNREKITKLLNAFSWKKYQSDYNILDEDNWPAQADLKKIYSLHPVPSDSLFSDLEEYEFDDNDSGGVYLYNITSTEIFWWYLDYYKLLFSEASEYKGGVYIELF